MIDKKKKTEEMETSFIRPDALVEEVKEAQEKKIRTSMPKKEVVYVCCYDLFYS